MKIHDTTIPFVSPACMGVRGDTAEECTSWESSSTKAG